MGDAILVQQVTSGGSEQTISSWKFYQLGSGNTISVGSHDRIIGLIGYGDNGPINYYVTVFQIAQNGSAELCDGSNKSLYLYFDGSYLGVSKIASTAFVSLQYSNGTLTITQQSRVKYAGMAFYCTVDF